jgi:hypothetical protein
MKIITEFTIELQIYHTEIVARLQYTDPDTKELQQSGLYSLREIENIIELWRDGYLMGGFGIGTRLAPNPARWMKQKE